MPYYYFDSTALVKRYSMERGTRIVNKLMVKRGKVAILPTWTVTELYSAFSNRAQQGDIRGIGRNRADDHEALGQRHFKSLNIGKL